MTTLDDVKACTQVVPHAGTWIEIRVYRTCVNCLQVVPHAGTWIEICNTGRKTPVICVVPHAGTWIEIYKEFLELEEISSRSPRGNVD